MSADGHEAAADNRLFKNERVVTRMTSKNQTNLRILMKEFRISGNGLAGYLNVDVSLVSKWKNGSRKIRQDYLEKIVRLFFSLDESNQYQRLNQISGFSRGKNFEPEKLAEYLKLWLSTSLDSEVHEFNPFVSGSVHTVSSYIYMGEQGKRDAIEIFLDYVGSRERQTIWLYSQQSADWLFGDTDYVHQWKSKNMTLIENNEVHVLHPVYKDYHAVAEYMLRWIPLHLYGNADAYYIPRNQISYVDSTICLTDSLALVSVTPLNQPKSMITYLLSDADSLKTLHYVISDIFNFSKPLFSRYSFLNPHKYHEAYQRFCMGTSRGICLTAGPPLFLIRRELLKTFVPQDMQSEDLDLICFERMKEHGIAPVTVIFHLDQLRQLLQYQYTQLRTVSYYLGKPVVITQDQLRQCLMDILELAGLHPEIRILWTDESIFAPHSDIDMFIREREIAGFVCSYDHTDEISRAITIEEDAVLYALFQNLNTYLETHPKCNCSLEDVRTRFKDLFQKYPIENCIHDSFSK